MSHLYAYEPQWGPREIDRLLVSSGKADKILTDHLTTD